MFVGSGGNITVQVGTDGVLIVDTQFAPLSDKIIAAIRKISDKPIRYIVNTHHHGDHTGGNVNLRARWRHGQRRQHGAAIRDSGVGAAIVAHENALLRLSAAAGPDKRCRRPGGRRARFSAPRRRSSSTARGFESCTCRRRIPTATASCSFAGPTSSPRATCSSPRIIRSSTVPPAVPIAGLVNALDRLVDIIIPVYGQDGGTLVVPGHGRLSNLGDVLNFREMVIVVRDRIQAMIDAGMTLEQVKAAKPTFDYDPVYGSTTAS